MTYLYVVLSIQFYLKKSIILDGIKAQVLNSDY